VPCPALPGRAPCHPGKAPCALPCAVPCPVPCHRASCALPCHPGRATLCPALCRVWQPNFGGVTRPTIPVSVLVGRGAIPEVRFGERGRIGVHGQAGLQLGCPVRRIEVSELNSGLASAKSSRFSRCDSPRLVNHGSLLWPCENTMGARFTSRFALPNRMV